MISFEKINFKKIFAKRKPFKFEGLNLVVCSVCKEIDCKCSLSNVSSEDNNDLNENEKRIDNKYLEKSYEGIIGPEENRLIRDDLNKHIPISLKTDEPSTSKNFDQSTRKKFNENSYFDKNNMSNIQKKYKDLMNTLEC